MKSPIGCLKLWMILSLLTGPTLSAEVVTYTFPPELASSDDFQVAVNGVRIPAIETAKGSFVSFGMTAPVELKIKFKTIPKSVVVRPIHAGIKAETKGKVCTVRIDQPRNLIVEVDGNFAEPLMVFANPNLPRPDPADPKVRFFEGGKIHEAGEIVLGDDETLFVEGGAVVHGVVRAKGARNVVIRGAGIFDASPRRTKTNMLVFRECENVRLENIIILNSFGWTIHLSGSRDIRLANTRVIGWRANCDGLDIEYCRNVRADGCFWQTSDDCIAVKALYPPGVKGIPFEEMIDPEKLGSHEVPRIEGDTVGDVVIADSVLWNNAGGNTFEFGFELRVDNVRGITFRNCDIIRGGASFSIHNGDRAVIEDLLFEDIRVENVARLIDFHVGLSIYSDDCPTPYRRSNPKRRGVPREHRPQLAGNVHQWYVPVEADLPQFANNRGLIRDVVIRNMKVVAAPRARSILNGYSASRDISNVLFEGLEVAGQTIGSAEEGGLYLRYADRIRFTVGGSQKE